MSHARSRHVLPVACTPASPVPTSRPPLANERASSVVIPSRPLIGTLTRRGQSAVSRPQILVDASLGLRRGRGFCHHRSPLRRRCSIEVSLAGIRSVALPLVDSAPASLVDDRFSAASAPCFRAPSIGQPRCNIQRRLFSLHEPIWYALRAVCIEETFRRARRSLGLTPAPRHRYTA